MLQGVSLEPSEIGPAKDYTETPRLKRTYLSPDTKKRSVCRSSLVQGVQPLKYYVLRVVV